VSDVIVSNGTLGTFTGSGSSYAIDVTAVSNASPVTVGISTGSFSDVAGNVNTAATSSASLSAYTSPAGQAVIDLGGLGKLIDPVQVNGNWYYHWDCSGNGTADANDYLTHNVLDGLFNKDINGSTNTTAANADGLFGTTETYRFGTINGVKLALPTDGVAGATNPATGSTPQLIPGTSAWGAGTPNTTYTDYAAIWDAFNGTGTGTLAQGIPPGWSNIAGYLAATPTVNGHVYFGFSGDFYNQIDTNAGAVALQVL
jgi:hypothetical protein